MKHSFYISLFLYLFSITGLCDGLNTTGYWIRDWNDHWYNATADIYSTTTVRLIHCAYLCLVNTECLMFGYNRITGVCHGFRFLDYSPKSIPEKSEVIYKHYQSCVRAGYILLENVHLCMKRYNKRLTWNDAQAQCENDHGRLVVIDNLKKLDAFVKYTDTAVWVGVNDIANEGTWVWLNGANLDRTYWAFVLLNNYSSDFKADMFSADCGCMQDRKLNDDNCLMQLPFVCEIPYLI